MQSVSVIIPFFGRPQWLPSTLRGLLAQSRVPNEIIVVDDGSPDGSAIEQVCREFDVVRYLRQENKGVSAARNKGIEYASGELLLFIDGDDLLHPQSIERLVSLSSVEDEVVGAVAGVFVDNSANRTGPAIRFETQSWLPELFLHTLPIHCHLIPRELVQNSGGFDEELSYGEDWDLWLRIALQGAKLNYSDWVGAYYRRTEGSASSNRANMIRSRAEIFARLWIRLREDEQFWDCWSSDYLRALLAIRRHMMINCGAETVLEVIHAAVSEMREKGVRLKEDAPLALRFTERLLASSGRFEDSFISLLSRIEKPLAAFRHNSR